MAQSGAGLEITHVGLVVGTGSKHKMLRSLPATLPTGVIPKPGQVDQRHRFEDQIWFTFARLWWAQTQSPFSARVVHERRPPLFRR